MRQIDFFPIYKYMSISGAIRTLEDGTLKFSCPTEFNDPFDCNMANLKFTKSQSTIDELNHAIDIAGVSEEDKAIWRVKIDDPRIFEEMQTYAVLDKIEKSKVTCFSKRRNNTLMWSHYSDQHKGVCLEFNGSVGTDRFLRKRLVDAFLEVTYDKTDSIYYNEDREKAVIDLFTRKSSDWR
ncbi:MAG: DUF2971 domain-containing protein, partial [Hymenobacter sp.]